MALKRSVTAIPNTSFLNADPGFVNANGYIKSSDMIDYLHLTRNAYKKFCNLIHDHIIKLNVL